MGLDRRSVSATHRGSRYAGGMRDRLREQWRRRLDRHAQPSAAVLNAQSTRVLPQGGESGFDACKKVKGPQASLARQYAGLAAGSHCHGRQCKTATARRPWWRRLGKRSANHLSSRREAANLVSRQSTNETSWAWIDSRWSAAWLMSALDGDEVRFLSAADIRIARARTSGRASN